MHTQSGIYIICIMRSCGAGFTHSFARRLGRLWRTGSPHGGFTRCARLVGLTANPLRTACAHQHYQRTVYNHTPLYGPWDRWRMAGGRLVSPHGDWIGPGLLDRWMWRHMRMFER